MFCSDIITAQFLFFGKLAGYEFCLNVNLNSCKSSKKTIKIFLIYNNSLLNNVLIDTVNFSIQKLYFKLAFHFENALLVQKKIMHT